MSEVLEDTLTATVSFPVPSSEVQVEEHFRHELTHASAYLYGNVKLAGELTASLGGSIDSIAGVDIDRKRFNPKLGLTWQPSSDTTVRGVAFRTLQGPFVSKFNIRPALEPTHVAGFNQQFFGSEGEVAWRFGAAVDHRISDNLYAGAELSRRELDSPITTIAQGSYEAVVRFPEIRESLGRGYVYWTPTSQLGASFAYQYEEFDNQGFAMSNGLTRVRTHRLPIELNYFHHSGLSAGATATFVDQAGDFSPMQIGPDAVTSAGGDQFWVTDLSLSYRLPARRGLVSLNMHNAFDQKFRFQDTDPENPRILPERMVLLKVTLSY